MSDQDIQNHKEHQARLVELNALDPISFEQLQAVFDNWMILPDRHVVKFLVSLYCANQLSRRAVWAVMVAPSGGGKTELLNSLVELPNMHEVSLLTPNTFLSGMPGGKDASLLNRIKSGTILMKDFTSILSMQRDARAEIMAQLREIWDGSLVKEFGNGQTRRWKGKLCIIAASTEAIDLSQQMYTHLGERFVYYRPIMPNRKAVGRRSLKNDDSQERMKTELQNAMFAFIKGIDFKKIADLPQVPETVQEELVDLANFCTMARSGIIRDLGPRKEVIFVPSAEMPTRILQQLSSLAAGAMIANDGVMTEADIGMLYKVALDSIPRTNKIVIQEMAKAEHQSTAEIATALGYPTDTIKIYLENLALLGVCKREKDSGKSDKWTMDDEFTQIIRKYEGIHALTDEQKKERESKGQGFTNDELEEAERIANADFE